MNHTLDGFELEEANASDTDEIINLMVRAYEDDEMWKYTFQNVPYYGQFRFFYEYNSARKKMEDVTCFKISEKATGYLHLLCVSFLLERADSRMNSKMVAYTALQYPWSIRPLIPELKTALSSLDPFAGLPVAPKGFRMDGFVEMFNMFTATHYEHDPEKDFRTYFMPDFKTTGSLANFQDRMGTHVLPEYQRRGLGSWLTKHCNSIADAHNAKTYVTAGCKSRGMFKALGFKKFGEFDPHAERWGREYDIEKAKYELLVRDPKVLRMVDN